MCTPDHMCTPEYPIPDVFPFALLMSSTILGRLSTRFWRILSTQELRALVRSGMMLSEEACSVVCIPIPPKVLQWGRGKGSVQATSIPPIQQCFYKPSFLHWALSQVWLSPFVPVKGNNAKAYKDILYSSVPPRCGNSLAKAQRPYTAKMSSDIYSNDIIVLIAHVCHFRLEFKWQNAKTCCC